MGDEEGFCFDDFSVEMEDFEVARIKAWDRIWRVGPGGSVSSGVLVHEGKVYFGSHNHLFYCLDAKTGRLIWKFRTSEAIHGGVGPVIMDDAVYFGGYDYNIYALDCNSGKLRWKFKTDGEINGGPCVDEKRLYVGSRDNSVYALDLKTGRLVWKFRTSDCVAGVPAVWGDRLYIGSFDKNFYCLDKRTGSLIWKFPTQGEIFNYTRALISKGTVYFTSFDNFLRAVDAETGKLAWKFHTGIYGISAGTVLYKGVLFQGSRDGNLYALSLDGKLLWKFSTHEMIIPVICHEDRVYFGSEDQNMYCLDLSGREHWRFSTQGMMVGQQAISDGRIFFGSYDCNLYCVDLKTRSLVWKFNCGGQPSYIPPPNESFEIRLKMHVEPEPLRKKVYDAAISEDEGKQESFYKSRITYNVSTRYREKGKYQTDDDL